MCYQAGKAASPTAQWNLVSSFGPGYRLLTVLSRDSGYRLTRTLSTHL